MEITAVIILSIVNICALIAIAVGYARMVWFEKKEKRLSDCIDDLYSRVEKVNCRINQVEAKIQGR